MFVELVNASGSQVKNNDNLYTNISIVHQPSSCKLSSAIRPFSPNDENLEDENALKGLLLPNDNNNINPIPLWANRTQIVSLDHRFFDQPMQINQALFAQNGRCGYIPIPSSTSSQPMKLSVKVISAQGIHSECNKTLHVQIVGVEGDCASFKTVEDIQGRSGGEFHYSLFDQTFTFQIAMPELAFFMFTILETESSGEDKCVATYCIAVGNMEQGRNLWIFILFYFFYGLLGFLFAIFFLIIYRISTRANV